MTELTTEQQIELRAFMKIVAAYMVKELVVYLRSGIARQEKTLDEGQRRLGK